MANKIYTFSEIVNTVITKMGSKGASLTDFNSGSNLRAIVDSVSHFVEYLQLRINVAIENFHIRTSKGEGLATRVGDWNMKPKKATPASDYVTLIRNTPAISTFTVYAGGQVSTQPDIFGNTINYTIDSDTVFPAGATQVTTKATCTVAGSIGNVPIASITNITSSLPGIDSVTNLVPFGSGSEAETDDQIKARLPLHVNGLKCGNEDAIRAAALSVDGINVARVGANEPTIGQFTVYISNATGNVAQAQVDAVKAAINKAASFCITTSVATPTISYVTVEMDIEFDVNRYNQEVTERNIKDALYNLISVNPETRLKTLDLALAVRSMGGVSNVTNVKINGVAADFTTTGFSVIRMADKNTDITLNWN